MLARNAWFNFQVVGCLLDMLLLSIFLFLIQLCAKNIFCKIQVTRVFGIHFMPSILSVIMHLPCTLEKIHLTYLQVWQHFAIVGCNFLQKLVDQGCCLCSDLQFPYRCLIIIIIIIFWLNY